MLLTIRSGNHSNLRAFAATVYHSAAVDTGSDWSQWVVRRCLFVLVCNAARTAVCVCMCVLSSSGWGGLNYRGSFVIVCVQPASPTLEAAECVYVWVWLSGQRMASEAAMEEVKAFNAEVRVSIDSILEGECSLGWIEEESRIDCPVENDPQLTNP